jgi:multiple sugar transport system ATP-binding protein
MNLFRARVDRSGGGLGLVIMENDERPAFTLQLDGDIEGLVDGRLLHLGIRPHRLRLGDGPGAITGTVASHAWLGDQTHIGIEVGGIGFVLVVNREVQVALGETITVHVPPSAVHLFDADSEQALFHGSEWQR